MLSQHQGPHLWQGECSWAESDLDLPKIIERNWPTSRNTNTSVQSLAFDKAGSALCCLNSTAGSVSALEQSTGGKKQNQKTQGSMTPSSGSKWMLWSLWNCTGSSMGFFKVRRMAKGKCTSKKDGGRVFCACWETHGTLFSGSFQNTSQTGKRGG